MVVDAANLGPAAMTDDEIDRLFRALADATRRDIVRRTMSTRTSVTELAAAYDMSFAAVQKHVAVLEQAGLVTKAAHGRQRLVGADPRQVARARALLDQLEALWHSRLSQLDQVLDEPTARPPSIDPPHPVPPAGATSAGATPTDPSPNPSTEPPTESSTQE